MEKFTKKNLRALVESTDYPMASIEKTMRLLDLLKKFNTARNVPKEEQEYLTNGRDGIFSMVVK